MTIEELYRIYQQHPEVTTDSRDCPEGAMFFALRGERFDGNEYAAECLSKGCSCAVVDDPKVVAEGDGRYILVDNVLRTLQLLSRHHRRTLGTTIVGITGTNGKTTTKELCAAVLGRKYNVHFTRGNFNNSIGVPKTLLQLRPEHELAVVEMGASHPGDIEELVTLVEPQYGLITNVGRAHLLGFGSFEGVCRTKGELYDFLRNHDGTVFLNTKDEKLTEMAQGLKQLPYVDGQGSCDPFLKVEVADELTVDTHLIGAYNTANVLAAVTVGRHFGVADADIKAALEAYTPSNSRSQFVKTERNALIVDAYNANPTSMAAALDNFQLLPAPHKMCIIGMMGELGQDSRMEHERLVDRLRHMQLEEVWLVGSEFGSLTLPPHTEGIIPIMRYYDSVEAVKTALADKPLQGRTILIKGSNSTHLFQLPALL